TMFRGIFKLPAGHMATYQNGDLKISQYWDLSFPKRDFDFRTDEETLAREVRHRFSESVKGQMLSDVPIGAFLSAGIDSTSIVSVMASESSHPVRTYTITFPRKYRVGEKTLDDPGVARRVAEGMGCDHHEIVVEPDVVSLLPKLAWHLDEPIADPAVIPAYLVCSKARESVTVLLSGVGGDELFAGYRKHYAHFWSEMYRKAPSYARMAFESVVLKLPSMRGTSAKGVVRLLKKMARSGSLSPREAFLMNCTYMDESQRTGLMSSEMLAVSERQHPASRHYDYFDNVSESDFLNQLLYLDTKAFMTSLNLTYNDKMSMASSLEVRVPFLDHELAEFVAWKVPPHLKIKGLLRPKTKYIFRKAMADRLPPEVLRQPKAGFGVPIDYWLTHDLRDMVDELLSESQVRDRGFFNSAPVHRMVAEHRAGTSDWSMQIWQLLTLEIWLRTFIDRTPSAKLHDSVATTVRA
ncbi:MAG TPA: asparagine synthase C-terminal domain-containing protein, partial [Terriglobales bacterium]|nr:asparagine synthase C-terminal domain-containing protein [Terriglobales bacterium]